MSFFPDNFELPKSNSGYLKLQEGENKIRILSEPIIGWQDWDSGKNKPVRYKYDSKPLLPLDITRPTILFTGTIVWDYAQNKICILQINQSSIMKKLDVLSKDKDWGSIYRYDIKIKKLKKVSSSPLDGNNVMYDVSPLPHRELDPLIKQAFIDTPINLEELFTGGDPFKSAFRTKGFWDMVAPSIVSTDETISIQEMGQIEDLIAKHISPVDPQWRTNALNALKITNFRELKKERHSLVLKRIDEKRATLMAEECPF